MTYFAENYQHFRWPIATETTAGLRKPQAGALHGLAAHFSHDREDRPVALEPAIVTMPTGSGKTAVIMSLPFILQSRRALVITPSRLVRDQIAENFSALQPLRDLGVLAADSSLPKVQSVDRRIVTATDWSELREFDVVIGAPNSLSPVFTGGETPPADLFDIVLVDEAHHAPARSWRTLLEAFPDAQHALFTATPFRRDRRELVGSFVYTYELLDAWRDGVFGQLRFEPVDPEPGKSDDESIALAAKTQLLADREAGLDHRLLIRTSTRTRARELVDIYNDTVGLRVEAVLGDHSLKHARRVIKKLKEGELDAIACVDMFGEGFDLPQLKLAALHSPHRSLNVVLQFIGRFARTTSSRLGAARFFAIASDMHVERVSLYQQGAAWDLLIPNLSASRIKREREMKEAISTFSEPAGDTPSATHSASLIARDINDVSLFSLRPYHHVKVFYAPDALNLSSQITFSDQLQIGLFKYSEKHRTAVYVLRELRRPEWATTDHFDEVSNDLIVLVHDPRTHFLFVCSSRRTAGLYDSIATSLSAAVGAELRTVASPVLNKALLDVDDPVFYNVGLANAIAANRSESYRVMMGSAAQDSIKRSDARSFRRGHWFCSGTMEGEKITLGLSSSSKIWSNSNDSIPGLVQWCHALGKKLVDKRRPTTSSNFDLLDAGEQATGIPSEVMFVDWPAEFFSQPLDVTYQDGDGVKQASLLLDLDIGVVEADHSKIDFTIEDDDGNSFLYTFSLDNGDPKIAAQHEEGLFAIRGREEVSLATMLAEHPPRFFTSTFGYLDGAVWYKPRDLQTESFDPAKFSTWDWKSLGIDVTNECRDKTDNGVSIHVGIETHLAKGDAEVVYFDHGSGEMADFVELIDDSADDPNRTLVRLYHCKATTSVTPAGRVQDAYEVCGQAVKSLAWASREKLLAAMKRRLKRKRPSRYVRGNVDDAERLLGRGREIVLEVIIVQPGFSKAELDKKLGLLLAAASDYLLSGPCKPLGVIGSS